MMELESQLDSNGDAFMFPGDFEACVEDDWLPGGGAGNGAVLSQESC